MKLKCAGVALFHFDELCGGGGGDFVEAVFAVDDELMLDVELLAGFGDDGKQFGFEDAGESALDGGGVAERPENVEEGPDT